MSDDSPMVSIVLPTKDRRALLAETIASVRAQTYDNWELIVADDRSTDGSGEFVRELARQDQRIKLVSLSGEKAGAPAARNAGVRDSSGSLIIFLDSDDLLAPSCLQRRTEVMRAHPQLDFAVFPCQVFREQPDDLQLLFNADTGEDDLDRLLKVDVPWQTTGPIWRRQALEKIGPWDEQALSAQDWEFHIRAIAAGLRYQRFGPPDCYWRRPSAERDSIGKSSQLEAEYMRGRVSVTRKMLALLRERSLLNEPRQKMFAALYFRSAQTLAERASRRDARDTWGAARNDRVISFSQFIEGWIYFFAFRWPPIRSRMRDRLHRNWPSDYFARPSETFLRAPMQLVGATS